MIRKLFFLLFLTSSQYAVAQPFKIFGPQKGYSLGTVHDILQDDDGFTWFASTEGLYYFDGASFTLFRHKANDPQSISENSVNCLTIDSSGVIWAGTENGLNVLIPDIKHKHFSFKSFFTKHDSTTHVDNHIISLAADKKSTLWIGTQTGLVRAKINGSAVDMDIQIMENHILNARVNSIIKDTSGMLWLATLGAGLIRYNPHNKEQLHFGREEGLPGRFLTRLFIDNNNVLWIGSFGAGISTLNLAKYNREKQAEFTIYKPDPAKKNNISDSRIYDFAEDDEGNIWAATFGSGIIKLQRNANTLVQTAHYDISKISGENDMVNYVRCLCIDSANNLLMGTNNGLIVHSLVKPIFNTISTQKTSSSFISDNVVLSVLKDRQGFIWIGSNKGIDKLSAGFDHLKYYDLPHNNRFHTSGFVTSLVEDKNGHIIAATFGGSLFSYDSQKDTFEQMFKSRNSRFTDTRIHCLLQDNSNKLWIASVKGLTTYNPETGHFSRIVSAAKKPIYARVLFQDSQNQIWICASSGIYLKAAPDDSLKKLTFITPEEKIPETNSICQDKNGVLWIATASGLFFYNSAAERIELFDNDFLNDIDIQNVTSDTKGKLWLTCYKGIVSLDPNSEQPKLKEFNISDGMQGTTFMPNALFKSDSIIFLGGNNGLDWFNPNVVPENITEPKINITSFRLFDKELLSGLDFKLQNHIDLAYDERYLSFEFTTMDFNSHYITFQYMLKNFDKGWHNAGKRNFAVYTNLEAGKYTFKVRAVNNDGVPGKYIKSFNVNIATPPWLSWWAYIIYLLLLAALFYFVRFLSIRQEKRRAKLKEVHLKLKTAQLQTHLLKIEKEVEKNDIRSHIADDLHDDIGSNLSSIKLMIDTMQKSKDLQPAVKKVLDEIYQTALYSTEAIRDIVWFVNPGSDNLRDLISRMHDACKRLMPEDRFTFNASNATSSETLSPQTKRNLYLTFKEALNNALIHSGASHINITIEKDDQYILKISDNGKGFDVDKYANGHGLKSMRSRAETIGGTFCIKSSPQKGTITTLAVPYDK